MSGALIGALRVSLGLDSAQFATGVKKARQEATSASAGIGSAFESIKGAAATAAAAVAAIGSAAVVMSVRKAVDAMDDLSKAAQKTGTSADELAKLQFAAKLSDVSSESLQKSLNKLNMAIVQIGPKAKGAAGALREIGVSAGSGTLDAMMKVADQFATMPDGAQKSALAIQLFGKAGAEMIPLLNGGSAAIKQAADEAERMGLVIDGTTARAAEEFNDNLTRLGSVVDGVQMQIAAGMVPSLAAMSKALVDGVNAGNGFASVGRAIGNGLVNVAEVAIKTGNAIGSLASRVVALSQASSLLYTKGDFFGAGKILSDNNDAIAKEYANTTKLFNDIRTEIANFKPGAVTQPVGGMDVLGGGAGAAAKKKEPSWMQRLRRGDFDTPSAPGKLEIVSPEQMMAVKQVAVDMGQIAVNVPKISQTEIFKQDVFAGAARLSESISGNLAQALVNGQSLGGALVNSLKAAAAQLASSVLMKLIGKGIGLALGGIGIPGFANGTRSAPGGLAMVGERGRELVNLPRGSQVISNPKTEQMMRAGANAPPQEVVVTVAPSPLFFTAVANATQSATNETFRQRTRSRMPVSAGA
jgi:hypothetical protein